MRLIAIRLTAILLISLLAISCAEQLPTSPTMLPLRSIASPVVSSARAPDAPVASLSIENPHNASGLWCSTGGCDEFQIVLTQQANNVTGSVTFDAFVADFEFVRRGPGRFHHLFTLTITGPGACSPATFTGTAEINTVENLLTATSSGTNTDCLPEQNDFTLVRQ